MRVGMHKAAEDREPQNLEIEADAPMADVEEVELEAFAKISIAAQYIPTGNVPHRILP